MATNGNKYVVNIVDLQNVAMSITGSASGSAAIEQLQSDVGNLQEMVNYDTKTIYADILTEFTNGHGIQLMANLVAENTATISGSTSVPTTVPSTTINNTVTQGSMAFNYTGTFSGSSGSLPTSFASSVISSGSSITITLNPTYSPSYFPNYYGTITWYTNSGYISSTIPSSNTIFTGTQIIVTPGLLAGITPDSTGYSLWLSMTVFN